MIEVNKFSKNLFVKAEAFERFRNQCKDYLQKVNMNFDKFTIVGHDSFIGYITEAVISDYILNSFDNVKVSSWENNHDIKKIIEIIETSDYSSESSSLVKEYFYDKWDIKIEINNKTLYCDVKTAYTSKDPNHSWVFMYPVVQATKDGKDFMILVYYMVNDIKNIKSLKKLIIVGSTTTDVIKKCKVIKAGEKTRFGTVSQIDNYLTELSKHYKPISSQIL